MAKSRLQTIIALGIAGVGLLIAGILGLFAYMSLTASPIHPDVQQVSAVSRSAPSPKWASATERARQLVRADLAEQNLPGVSVAVGIDSELVWSEGFGWADIYNKVPVTPETRFRTGEASKPLTSAAVGLLLEKQALKLDEEVQTYVRDFPKKQWPVTLRQLMAHTAGLRDDAGDEAYMQTCERTADGFKLFADDALLFEPGTKYHPSSYSWILVSAAVEQAGDERFTTFMRSKVFDPVGMTATRLDVFADMIPERAIFYFPKFAGDPRYGPDLAREGDHSCYAGASGFLSTPTDLARFGMAFNSGKLVQPATVQLLQTEQKLPSGETTGYGLGWKVESLQLAGQSARMAGHGVKGDFIGGTTYLMTFPERGIVVAVMTNVSFADAKAVALKVADVFAAAK